MRSMGSILRAAPARRWAREHERLEHPEVIDRTVGRLCALHLHDNDGTCDAHLPMGQGSIDWSRTFASMRQLPESCVFIMEYQTGTDLEKLAEGRDMLLAALG